MKIKLCFLKLSDNPNSKCYPKADNKQRPNKINNFKRQQPIEHYQWNTYTISDITPVSNMHCKLSDGVFWTCKQPLESELLFRINTGSDFFAKELYLLTASGPRALSMRSYSSLNTLTNSVLKDCRSLLVHATEQQTHQKSCLHSWR